MKTEHILKAFSFIGNDMRHVIYDDFTLIPLVGYFAQTFKAIELIGYVYTVNPEQVTLQTVTKIGKRLHDLGASAIIMRKHPTKRYYDKYWTNFVFAILSQENKNKKLCPYLEDLKVD